jgi:hypothetical protein
MNLSINSLECKYKNCFGITTFSNLLEGNKKRFTNGLVDIYIEEIENFNFIEYIEINNIKINDLDNCLPKKSVCNSFFNCLNQFNLNNSFFNDNGFFFFFFKKILKVL